MPQGKGTYGSKRGRPSKTNKKKFVKNKPTHKPTKRVA